MNNIAISVENMSKDFKVYYDKAGSLKEKMMFWKRNKSEIKKETPEQPKPVEVAKKGSGTMERIKQFGRDHKKELKVAGAIAGTAAAAGIGYHLYKKHKAKKAKEEEEQNKSESFNVYEFDECVYVTESTMDMLLEACEYELSEKEILDNISEVINFYER